MEKMHYNISVRLFTAGKCFGPGMAALLSLVRERHSLRAAAAEMGMAYSKAWRILRDCEGALGFPLLDSTTGGRHGGGALLGQDVPPFIIVRNDTMRFAGINKIGLSRRGFTPERIGEIHDACRILFQSGLNYMSGCEEVEKQVPQSKERDELVRFIRESKRGIIKPYESKAKEE